MCSVAIVFDARLLVGLHRHLVAKLLKKLQQIPSISNNTFTFFHFINKILEERDAFALNFRQILRFPRQISPTAISSTL